MKPTERQTRKLNKIFGDDIAKALPKHKSSFSRIIVVSIFTSLLLLLAFSRLYQSPSGSEHDFIDCKIGRIIDGDSVVLECLQNLSKKGRSRLFCIDAPEMDQQPWGQLAKASLQSKILSPSVDVNIMAPNDLYDRAIVEIFYHSLNLNLELVREGSAAVYREYCHREDYFAAEAEARSHNRGIWSKSNDDYHQTPWAYRKAKKN